MKKPRIIRYKRKQSLLERLDPWLAVIAVVSLIALSVYSYQKYAHADTFDMYGNKRSDVAAFIDAQKTQREVLQELGYDQ